MSTAAIVTRGVGFTPSLIVTAGFYGGAAVIPPAVSARQYGGWLPPQGKKKRKQSQAPSWLPLGPTAKESMMGVIFDIGEREDEEDLLSLMRFD